MVRSRFARGGRYGRMGVAAIMLLLAPAQPLSAQQANPGAAPSVVQLDQLRPEHPRLFADSRKFADLRRQDDVVTRDLKRIIIRDAQSYLTKERIVYPPAGSNVEYPGPGGKFGAMREAQARILALSMAFRLTGERRYFEKARRELLDLSAVPDWNPKHYITLAEGAFAAAVGYDWLYNELTVEDRNTIANAITTKALAQSLEAKPDVANGYEVNRSWLDGVLNWNPVVNGGLAVAALAVGEREPDLAKQVLDRSVHYIQFAGRGYEPDGVWLEAPNYWAFGTSYYVVAADALRSALGSDYGVSDYDGFQKTGEYNFQTFSPVGRYFNYSDYGEEYQNEPQMLWLARETGRSELARTELADIARLAGRSSAERMRGEPMETNKHTPLALIWWSPALLKDADQNFHLPLHWTAGGRMPLAIMRTSWSDPNATYVALKGGTATDSHSHMDGGSFVLDAGGVRWAVDLGSESYDMMRKVKLDLWNMTQESPRWATFRVGPEGHNILRFDGGRQIVSARGKLTSLPAPTVGNQIDLSEYYAPYVRSAHRTVRLIPNVPGGVEIKDEWQLRSRPISVGFQWLTRSRVTLTSHGFALTEEGRTLDVVVDGADEGIIIEDVSAPRAPQDSPNPGLTRITIKRSSPANGRGQFVLRTKLRGVPES